MYTELAQALNEVGFSGDEQAGIHETLALILFLGNLSFDAVYSDVDPAQISSPPAVIQRACALIGCDEAAMREALLYSIQVTRGETIRKTYTCQQAAEGRDAFAKALYGRLFGWIVSQVRTQTAAMLGRVPFKWVLLSSYVAHFIAYAL
jgi:myosin-3